MIRRSLRTRRSKSLAAVPTITSATEVGPSGGSSRVIGTNFTPGITAQILSGGSVVATPTVSLRSTTRINLSSIPSLSAGTYDIKVYPPGGLPVTALGVLTVESSVTFSPMTIAGPRVILWNRSDQITQSGGKASAYTDLAHLGNTFTQATGANQPAVVASDSNFNSQATLNFTGNPVTMTLSSLKFDTGTNQATIYAVIRSTGGTSNLVRYNPAAGGSFGIQLISGTSLQGFRNVTTATWGGGSPQNTTKHMFVEYLRTGLGTGTVGIDCDNDGAEVTANATTADLAGNGSLALMSTGSGTSYGAGQVAEVIVLDDVLNNTEKANFEIYFGRYDAAPTFTNATNTGTAGGGVRITGTGFRTGVTVSATGIGALTVNTQTSTLLNVTVPAASAGDYDLVITNPDGQSVTASASLHVKSSATFDPMVIAGRKCILWNRADQITQSGGKASAFTDLALFGNFLSQATGANQPTVTASDANFNNQQTLSFGGSPVTMLLSALAFDGGASAGNLMILAAIRPTISTTCNLIRYNASSAFGLEIISTNSARVFRGATDKAWGSSLLNTKSYVALRNSKTGSGTFSIGINVANGTELTNTGSVADLANNAQLSLFSAGASSYGTGQIADIAVFDQILTSTELANMQTYFVGRYG